MDKEINKQPCSLMYDHIKDRVDLKQNQWVKVLQKIISFNIWKNFIVICNNLQRNKGPYEKMPCSLDDLYAYSHLSKREAKVYHTGVCTCM